MEMILYTPHKHSKR